MLGPGIVHCLWLYSCLVSLSFICIHRQPASRQLAASLNYASRLLSTASSFPASILMTASLTGGVRSVTEVSNIYYCDTCRPEQLPDTTEDREGDCCSSSAVCSHKPDHCSGERCSPGPCMRTADVTCSLCSHSNTAVSGKWSLVVSINPLCTSSRCDLG